MPDSTLWFLAAGLLLVFMALAGSVLKRLPMSASMFYVAAGVGPGPLGLGLLTVGPVEHAAVLERVTEVVVLVLLFVAGLKLRVRPSDRRWRLPARLAFGSVPATVGLVALLGIYGLGLPVGAAVLLGAVLAPTSTSYDNDHQALAQILAVWTGFLRRPGGEPRGGYRRTDPQRRPDHRRVRGRTGG